MSVKKFAEGFFKMTRLALPFCVCLLIVPPSQKCWNVVAVASSMHSAHTTDSSPEDKSAVAAMDEQYQAAVKRNDGRTMDRILADNFVLVTGSGKTYSKKDLLEEARSGRYIYEHQEDTERTVRVWGDTAVVTAKLWEKGTRDGHAFDYTVWFSDVYTRGPQGWRCVFGQSSLPLANPL
jgi:ketosteroid isomerase-like protein